LKRVKIAKYPVKLKYLINSPIEEKPTLLSPPAPT